MLKEALIVWVVFIGLVRLTDFFGARFFGADLVGLLTAVLGLYLPLLIYFKRKEKITFLESSLQQFGKSFITFVLFSVVIFSVAVAANHFYQLLGGFSYHPGRFEGPLLFFLSQLVMIALPEEFFFRGYLQDRFNQIFKKHIRLLGVQVSASLPLVAFLFAISHSLIHFEGWHLLIFFPAVAFGWLREKTGGLVAPILFHATCNLFAHWVWVHYGKI